MNERIKELIKQATNPDYDSDDGPMNEINIEKFAELIVRECLETIEEMDPHSAMRDIDDIYVVVEKHFGVEE